MRKLLAALLLLPLLANAAGNDLLLNQRRSDDSATLTRGVSPPGGGGTNAILGYVGASNLPAFFSIGQGLSLSSGLLTGFSGAYGDLTGTPTVFAPAAHVHPISQVTGLQSSLDGKMSAPAGNSGQYLRGDGSLATFPALFSGAYSSLTGIPATFAPTVHTQAWSTITATPTTVSGYGITDAATSAQLASYATTASLTNGLASKLNTPAGTTSQYVRGDGSLATLPAARRIETYTGTTDANGLYTVTYPSAFSSVPSVQPQPPTAANQVWVVVSSTANGFSLRLTQRASVNLLSVEVLLAATTNVAAAPAQVLVVSQ